MTTESNDNNVCPSCNSTDTELTPATTGEPTEELSCHKCGGKFFRTVGKEVADSDGTVATGEIKSSIHGKLPAPPPGSYNPVALKPRVTVVESVHCELFDSDELSDPNGVSVRYDYRSFVDESVYDRRIAVPSGPEQTQLDLGWFKPTQIGELVIVNLKTRSPVELSEKEEVEAGSHTVQVTIGEQIICNIPVGRSMRIPCVIFPDKLKLKCHNGTAKVRICLFPG